MSLMRCYLHGKEGVQPAVTFDSFSRFTNVGFTYFFMIESPTHLNIFSCPAILHYVKGDEYFDSLLLPLCNNRWVRISVGYNTCFDRAKSSSLTMPRTPN